MAPTGAERAPVLFLVFNRLDTTMRVLEAIRAARPPRLYVAADGARAGKEGEDARVQAVRDHILSRVDWPCEVKTHFREHNLGCKMAVSGGISWFFEHESEGIILEDDCLPAPGFFPFCEALLARHRNDQQVAGITGDFRPVTGGDDPSGYGRIPYPLIWGWASWRRVWQHYSTDLSGFDGSVDTLGRLASAPRGTRRYFEDEMMRVASGELNTWDYQFTHLVLRKGWSFLHPQVNLISNLGFDGPATNTSDPENPFAALPLGEVKFPLHPVTGGFDYTAWLEEHVFSADLLPMKVVKRVGRMIRGKRTGR